VVLPNLFTLGEIGEHYGRFFALEKPNELVSGREGQVVRPAYSESGVRAVSAETTPVRSDNDMPDADDSVSLSNAAAAAVARIRDILVRSRNEALQAVNATMVRAYWEVGREIVVEEQRGRGRADYGVRLIETLAERLTTEFGKGFNETNLKYMRQFYVAYPNRHAPRDESATPLSWTHYRLLLKVANSEARAFYEREAVRARWSTRELERQVNSLLYERLALSRDKEGVLRLAEQGAEAATPSDLIRDPFVLEFAGLPERGIWKESDLENALMDRMQEFLLELGSDFFFVARQKRLTIDGEHYKVDLVFYHRTLRCFVLIDLKIGKLSHADIGQMLLYVGYYEQEATRSGENPPVGLILSTDRSDAIVRYTLSKSGQQVFAARYQMHLPTEEELRRELLREQQQVLLEQSLQQDAP
jgi:predicted nuclease of restriction endonuclease-like (RecB) superfamily